MKAPRLGAAVGALALVLALLSGCWDAQDISDRTPALALGFDHTGKGWRVTIAEAVVSPGGTGAYKPYAHFGSGPTLMAAVEDLQSHLARRLYVGSARVVLLGQGVVRSSAPVVLRLLTERQEVDETAFFAAAEPTAQHVLEAPDGAFGSSAVRLLKDLEGPSRARVGHAALQIWQAQRDLATPGKGSFLALPLFAAGTGPGVAAMGTVLVGGDGRERLVLDRDQTTALHWLMGVPSRSILRLEDGSEVTPSAVKTKARLTDAGHLALTLRVRAIAYAIRHTAVIDSAMRAKLSQETAEVVLARTAALVAALKAAGVDPAGWSELARQRGLAGYDIRRLEVRLRVVASVSPVFTKSL